MPKLRKQCQGRHALTEVPGLIRQMKYFLNR